MMIREETSSMWLWFFGLAFFMALVRSYKDELGEGLHMLGEFFLIAIFVEIFLRCAKKEHR